jgi:hypothetical protein
MSSNHINKRQALQQKGRWNPTQLEMILLFVSDPCNASSIADLRKFTAVIQDKNVPMKYHMFLRLKRKFFYRLQLR